jgi:hypothetical protein
MAHFVVNQDVQTDVPTIEVTIDATSALPIGRHRFRLVVVDDSGNVSAPDEADVIVADTQAPTAVLAVPGSVAFATSFNLDGRKSFDAGGGKIVQFRWTYLGPSPR